MTLMKRFNALVNDYIVNYINAPVRFGQRVFGKMMPTKNDIRKGFLSDLKMLAEVAQLTGDKDVLDKINCVVTKDEKDIADLEKEIATITAPQ